MLKKNYWYVIKRENKPFLVCGKTHDSFYWGQHVSWCSFYNSDEIIETLGECDPELVDELEKNFYRKYYPPVELKEKDFFASAGWLSPEGKFYACSPSGHYGLAKRISIYFYDCIDKPEEVIIEKYWLKVTDEGRVYDIRIEIDPKAKFSITQEQENTLEKLAAVGHTKWADFILSYLEHNYYEET